MTFFGLHCSPAILLSLQALASALMNNINKVIIKLLSTAATYSYIRVKTSFDSLHQCSLRFVAVAHDEIRIFTFTFRSR